MFIVDISKSLFHAAMNPGATGAASLSTITRRSTEQVMGMRGQAMPAYGFLRHGSVERGLPTRYPSAPAFNRQRSRDGRDGRSGPDVRSGPAGPQERQEWLDALQDVKERVGTLESIQRNHAQSIAGNSGLIEKLNSKLSATDEDIVKYKEYISNQLFSAPTSVENSIRKINLKVDEFVNLMADTLEARLAATDVRLEEIQSSIDILAGNIHQTIDPNRENGPGENAQRFSMQTPAQPPEEEVIVGRPVNPADYFHQSPSIIRGQVIE